MGNGKVTVNLFPAERGGDKEKIPVGMLER